MPKKAGELTSKQAHFCRCVASGMNQTEAYRESFNVGPDTKDQTVHGMAYRLARKPHIRERIDSLLQMKDRGEIASSIGDKERVLRALRDLGETAKPSDMARIRALELLGKAAGLFKDTERKPGAVSAAEVQRRIEEKLSALSALSQGKAKAEPEAEPLPALPVEGAAEDDGELGQHVSH